jgi:hypothetical protein
MLHGINPHQAVLLYRHILIWSPPALCYNALRISITFGGTMRARGRIPSGATIVAWLGTIATLLGIVSFFILDLPSILSGGGNDGNLSQDSIIATMAALQGEKQDAQFQLTQIAVANAQAANVATQQALATQAAQFQAELAAVRATSDAFAATQNAIAASTSAADAATATGNAVGTQAVLDVTATAAFIAQIPTDIPTNTPFPTDTAVPPPATDYRSIAGADLRLNSEGLLELALQVAQPIPDSPPGDLAYVWLLDTDQDATTGLSVQDIGADLRIAAQVENGQWVGTVRAILPDGTLGDPLYISDINISDSTVSMLLNPGHFELPGFFTWVVRAEEGSVSYPLFPETGHQTYNQ